MTEMEKAKAGKSYDEAALWAEMETDALKALVEAAQDTPTDEYVEEGDESSATNEAKPVPEQN